MPRKRKGVTASQQRERLKRQQSSTNRDELRCDQDESNLSISTHTPKTCKVISGTFHQGDTRFHCPGVQCAFISLIALIRMTQKDPQSWTQRDIDSCLFDGLMFLKHCETLGVQPKMLMANELPNVIHFPKKSYTCNQSESDNAVGLLNPSTSGGDKCIVKGIDISIVELFKSTQSCLLFCGGLAIAIAKVESHLCTFDSHSRGKDGLLEPDGTAVLLVFDNLNGLVCHIKQLFMESLKLRPSEQFELVPLNISQKSIENETESIEIISPSSPIESLNTKASITKKRESPDQTETQRVDTTKSIQTYFEDQQKRQKLFEKREI